MAASKTRYRPLRPLKKGGMGAVDLVFDQVRGQPVARKRARVSEPDAILAFKREFRLIEQLSHPGLVHLYELGEDDQGLYYTMEYVEGVNLLVRCRGGLDPTRAGEAATSNGHTIDTSVISVSDAAPELNDPPPRVHDEVTTAPPRVLSPCAFDIERLAAALPQVIETLVFLHTNDVIHRDLKPSNVLVRENGVVKLLDFGILGHARQNDPEAGKMVGTVGYMAPEQIRGECPTPATDIYALGALLFEIVTGRPVFTGDAREVLDAHLKYEPPEIDRLVTGVPLELRDAVCSMLRKDPGLRPTLKELSRTLLPGIGARAPIHVPSRALLPTIDGRRQEQELLRAAIAAIPASRALECIVLCGPVGCGKSTLASWAARQAERSGLVVLRGGGHSRQHVSFNAIDGAIDALALEINRREALEVEQPLATARQCFPVLAPHPGALATEPPAARSAVFGAVVELVRAVADDSNGLMLLLDDLGVADVDSLALLDHLVELAPARVLVLATIRDDDGESAAARWLASRADLRVQRVGLLPQSAIEAIIRRLARKGGVAEKELDVAKVAATCGGSPQLALLAGRALAKTGGGHEDLVPSLAALIVRTSSVTQRVLAVLAASPTWATVSELARATGLSPGTVEDAVTDAAKIGLVRSTEGGSMEAEVELSHDLVRAAVLATVAARDD